MSRGGGGDKGGCKQKCCKNFCCASVFCTGGGGAAGSRSKQMSKGPSSKMLAQGNNLRLRDEGGSQDRSSTQDQKSKTVSSGHLLETASSEPLLRPRLRTLFYCKTHSRPPSQNPSQNVLRTLLRTLCGRFIAIVRHPGCPVIWVPD